MRGQFAGVEELLELLGCALGMRDRVVGVRAVAALAHAMMLRERGILVGPKAVEIDGRRVGLGTTDALPKRYCVGAVSAAQDLASQMLCEL